MRALNRVELIGRLGADPELRYTQQGTPVATLSVATNEQWTDKTTGEMREETEWHRVILWQRLAEIAQQYIRKGSRVFVAGQIKTRKWQDQSGQDRYTTEVRARDLMMLDSQGEQPSAFQTPPQSHQGQAAQHQPNAQARPQQPHPHAPAPFGMQPDNAADFDDDIPF